MIPIIVNLLVGYLLHFVHLDDLFKNLLGFNQTQYYLLFLFTGSVVFIRNAVMKIK